MEGRWPYKHSSRGYSNATTSQEHLRLPEAERGKEKSSPKGFGKRILLLRPMHSFWTSTLQNCETINFSCVKPHRCDDLLQHPWETNMADQ